MGFFNVRFNRALPCQLECYHSDPAQIECSMVSVVAYNEMVMMFWYVEFIKKKKQIRALQKLKIHLMSSRSRGTVVEGVK